MSKGSPPTTRKNWDGHLYAEVKVDAKLALARATGEFEFKYLHKLPYCVKFSEQGRDSRFPKYSHNLVI